MGRMNIEVKDMTEQQAKDYLQSLINELDNLDGDDFFGTEGWRHTLGFDD